MVEKHWYTVCVMDISACMGQSAAEQQQEGKTVGNGGSCRHRGVAGKQEQVTHAGVAASEVQNTAQLKQGTSLQRLVHAPSSNQTVVVGLCDSQSLVVGRKE